MGPAGAKGGRGLMHYRNSGGIGGAGGQNRQTGALMEGTSPRHPDRVFDGLCLFCRNSSGNGFYHRWEREAYVDK